MRHYLIGALISLLSCLTLNPSPAVSQESAPGLDLGIRLLDPSVLGLESTAAARASGSSRLSFALGSEGKTEITLEIVADAVDVDSKVKMEEFLSESGIRPDANAQSFVYYLNPDLSRVGAITKGTNLQLPVVRSEDGRELPRQPIIALVMEPKLKSDLRGSIDSFRSVAEQKEKDFAPEFRDRVKSVELDLDEFYRDRPASSREMLDQVNADVTGLSLIFAKYSRKSRGAFSKGPKLSLSPADLQQFNLIGRDLHDKVQWARQGNPQVKVRARTFKDGKEVSNFIVCYVPEARYKENQCDRSFSELSSPTNEQSMAIATYKFWATKPDGAAASDVRGISVRWQDGQAMTVDLTIR